MNNFPTAPLNELYVKLKQKFYDHIDYPSGVTLYKDVTYHPEESTMLEASVVSVPRGIMDRYDYKAMKTDRIKPGDTILMRYDVVFCYTDQPERTTPIYKNLLLYNGEEYWRVDIQQVFGVVRAAGIEMINEYVLVDPLVERVTHGSFYVPKDFQTLQSRDRFTVRAIGEGASVAPEASIYARPGVAQHYETDTERFAILKQSHLFAVDENMG